MAAGRCARPGCPPRPAEAGDHRERAHGERRAGHRRCCTRLRELGVASPSTTSAPATRRSATCTASRSTRSRSTARSCAAWPRRRRERRDRAHDRRAGAQPRHGRGGRGRRDRGAARACSGLGCHYGQGYCSRGRWTASAPVRCWRMKPAGCARPRLHRRPCWWDREILFWINQHLTSPWLDQALFRSHLMGTLPFCAALVVAVAGWHLRRHEPRPAAGLDRAAASPRTWCR